ncbi:Phospholipid-transporting ATPase IG [Clonorchis sinensis]|uniref:Phospholipid-transporting ATPase n=1 Tax=Clonorchis sinensis TaxID=79923 RepID=A0A8T1MUZ0_CLOSI|nr:Phospholipid-transporting ATPase IG [Clonorchis sinensis]
MPLTLNQDEMHDCSEIPTVRLTHLDVSVKFTCNPPLPDNVYSALLGELCSGDASGAISAFAYVVPFVFAVFIAMLKEGIYDIFRHIGDRRVNNKCFSVLEFDTNNNQLVWKERCSSSLRVGQIVRCVADQEIPCDLVLLASDGCKREVRLTTANLDGETSVKTHCALKKTFKNYGKILSMFPNDMELDDVTQFKPLLIEVTYEAPHADFHRFEGNLITSTSNGAENLMPILVENLAFRGAVLHNTGCILGLVVYTGVDTKLSMNSKKRGRKYSSREGKLNFVLTLFLVTSILLCAICTILATVWNTQRANFPWFISTRLPTRFSYVRTLISFAFIANFLVPVSLIITIELQMLMNSYLITHDPEFFDPQRGLGGSANSVHLADELGQIEFLFSDKTGTLTLNQMVFKACSILSDDGVYLFDGNDVRRLKTEAEQPCKKVTEMQQSNVWGVGSALPVHLTEFLMVVALCHTVETRPDINGGSAKFEATSPDEKALVEGAAKLGVSLISTQPHPNIQGGRLLVLQRQDFSEKTSCRGTGTTTEEYIVDATLEFDPIRKQMTVMVQHPDGTFHIHSKGAETAILEKRASSRSTSQLHLKALEQVNEFGLSGLRTLVYATKQITRDEYYSLLQERRQAMRQFGEARVRALKASNDKIESGLELLAVTAVEDTLQPGVNECLQSLKTAGIKVWVLTGDKEETAVTVSQAAGHFAESMTLLRITDCREFNEAAELVFKSLREVDTDCEQRYALAKSPLSPTLDEINEVVYTVAEQEIEEYISNETQCDRSNLERSVRKIQAFRDRLFAYTSGSNNPRVPKRRSPFKSGPADKTFGLVIDGESLKHALHASFAFSKPYFSYQQILPLVLSPSLRMAFLDLCMNVTAVLCCRVTPLQKASIVQLVQLGLGESNHGAGPVTAAVGDGGNDVSMISQANVGIGIYGEEGREATRAADYALPQFRHLQRLLFVHGQWCYHRISYTMLLYYFKCVAWVTLNMIYTFYSGFSANSWHSSLIFALYTLTLTAVPNLFFGIFERHITADQLLENPKFYRSVSRNKNLRLSHLILFVLDGIWHGLVIFYSVSLFLAGGGHFSEAIFIDSMSKGNQFDISLCGGSSMVYVIVSVNLRVIFMSRDINWPVVGGFIYTLVFNLVLIMGVQFTVPPASPDYLTYVKLIKSPAFWLALPISVFVANLPALLWRVYSDIWLQTCAQSDRQGVEAKRKFQRTNSNGRNLRFWLDKDRWNETNQFCPSHDACFNTESLCLREIDEVETTSVRDFRLHFLTFGQKEAQNGLFSLLNDYRTLIHELMPATRTNTRTSENSFIYKLGNVSPKIFS